MMHPIDNILKGKYPYVLYQNRNISRKEIIKKSKVYYDWLETRRSVRDFSKDPVPKEVVENIILSASTAPSGAHKQPWTFCAISNQKLKSEVRIAAEIEEKKNYENRMSERWKLDLAPLGTNMNKPFIEDAPWVIVAFKRIYEKDEDGTKHNNYYVNESIGIACGMLISAIHNAGLVTLTHTPSPMNFLAKLLDRPDNERAYLLLPIGFAKKPSYVPDIKRKFLEGVSVFYD